ncbi:MAG: hypothetical protein ABI618_03830 [Nitrospirota bacterium]
MRHGAFIPSSSNLKLSVFRIYTLSDEEIWALAVEKVEPARGKVIGRGDLRVSGIIENSLRVPPDEDPESRHADIVGWPDDRNHRATIAKVLAALASPATMRGFSTEQTHPA